MSDCYQFSLFYLGLVRYLASLSFPYLHCPSFLLDSLVLWSFGHTLSGIRPINVRTRSIMSSCCRISFEDFINFIFMEVLVRFFFFIFHPHIIIYPTYCQLAERTTQLKNTKKNKSIKKIKTKSLLFVSLDS